MFMSFATSESMFEYLGLRKDTRTPSKKLSIIRRLSSKVRTSSPTFARCARNGFQISSSSQDVVESLTPPQ